jgi:predicted membrane chloride channel (bestrophin family)
MCNTIERNLLDMTGQHPLPETLRPDRAFIAALCAAGHAGTGK